MPTNPTNSPSQPRSVTDPAPETKPPNQQTSPPGTAEPSGTQTPLTLQAGARPVLDYELVRRLGKGGFGEVWQARGPGGLDFALKFIELEARGSQLEVRALEMMKSIRHPNLVGLTGVWQRDNVLILAMELCDRSLQDRLNEALAQQQRGLPMNELLKYMRDAANGLDALHAKKVQHRDVKPLNLLLMQGGVKVADFGLAKVLETTVASHTGAMTPAYAAPEFIKGETSQHSDQYSLAASYIHLRTGHTLFTGNHHQIANSHLSVPPDLSELSEGERAVVARALDKVPDKRWPSCTAFVNSLIKAFNSERHGSKPKTEKATPRDSVFQQTTVLKPTPTKRPSQEKTTVLQRPAPATRWLWPVLAGLFLVVLVSCGAVGALGLGIGLFSNRKAIEATNPDFPSFVDLGGGVRMEFIFIDPKAKPDGGKFKMGSPVGEKDRSESELQHDVELTKPYYLAKYLVTQEQYQQVMGNNPSLIRDDSGQLPVDNVTWNDANNFCQEMMKKYDKQIPAAFRQPKYRFALPTEAQWEYACRAGTTTAYYFGADPKNLGDYAWFDGNSAKCTHQVGQKKSNDWGLYDMHGNVWQWCEDYYGPYNEGLDQKDPIRKFRFADMIHVLRGGSWVVVARLCRSASRSSDPSAIFPHNDIGFRVAFRQD